MKIYTSCYKTMVKRHKKENDIYVKVSAGLYYPFKNPDGIFMKDLIDADWGGAFAPHSDLDSYKDNLSMDDLKEFVNCLDFDEDVNIFLLCFEKLDEVYTKADERKYPDNPYIKAGKNKVCHRTKLAEKLNELYNLHITEYSE